MYHTSFIRSFVDRHLGCFHLLAIVRDTAMNVRVQASLPDPAFSSFESMPRNGIAGTYG